MSRTAERSTSRLGMRKPSNLKQVNITDYILDHTFPVPESPVSASYTISTDHLSGLEYLKTLHEISPIVNGIAMELLVDFSISERFHVYGSFSKSYDAIAKQLAHDVDESFFSGEPLFSNDIDGLLRDYHHIDNESYRDSYLSDHTIPQTTVFFILAFIAHSLDKFGKHISHSIITAYLQSIVRNWNYFTDLCAYMFCIRPILEEHMTKHTFNIRFGLPCGFRTRYQEYLGEIDMLVNETIIDVKCAKYPRYDQWSRQLHMYAFGMNVYNGLATVPYDLCVVNVYTNEILMFEKMDSFDIESFEK